VPLSTDGAREIEAYLKVRRRQRLPAAADAPLLCNSRRDGGAYSGEGFAHGIRDLLHDAGIRTAEGHLPRVHDFRHYAECRIMPSQARAHDGFSRRPERCRLIDSA
jgi:site-specific recombinase XerD